MQSRLIRVLQHLRQLGDVRRDPPRLVSLTAKPLALLTNGFTLTRKRTVFSDDNRWAVEPTVKHEYFTEARFDRHKNNALAVALKRRFHGGGTAPTGNT